MTGSLSAVILSAGFSARMEAFKPLLPLGGRPLLAHVIESVQSADPDEILVVLGHRADELAPIVRNAGASVVMNARPEQGMFSSVLAGVKALSPDCGAFMIHPVDIPLLRPATFRRLAQARLRETARILYPDFMGQRGHPPVIPKEMIPAILSASGQGGLRAVLAGHENLAVSIPVADENILFDLDRPEDYEAAVKRLAGIIDPTPAECEAVLAHVCRTHEDVVRHSRMVRSVALALCRAMNRAGAEIDENRVAAAALLHDIAKGVRGHAGEGAKILRGLGFDRVAGIVATHTDLPEDAVHPPGEAAILYLADKLVQSDRLVCLETRFETALERHGGDPAVRRKIEKRRATALAVKKAVEDLTGSPLPQILSKAGLAVPA